MIAADATMSIMHSNMISKFSQTVKVCASVCSSLHQAEHAVNYLPSVDEEFVRIEKPRVKTDIHLNRTVARCSGNF